jgi:hypothetical protein
MKRIKSFGVCNRDRPITAVGCHRNCNWCSVIERGESVFIIANDNYFSFADENVL